MMNTQEIFHIVAKTLTNFYLPVHNWKENMHARLI